jgi:uncharacterized protein (TIGR03382 family)
VCAAALAVCAPPALAVTIDTVPVGNAGNGNDNTLFGAVDYNYWIGTYEVTNNEYAEFLNAKAVSDPLDLYHTSMHGNVNGGITRSGSSGSYTYAVKTGMGNKPVNYVSWYDAIRFANWLHNGQGAGNTETGAYTLLGGTATPSNGLSITRNPGAVWFLPSENEWYKAAYHKNNGVTNNYWDYPTGVDSPVPSNSLTDTGNNANTNYATSSPNVTDVGYFSLSDSPYGTFDQGGNLEEWNEALISGTTRRVRGGSWNNFSTLLAAGVGSNYDPTTEVNDRGFRVAMIPEPTSSSLALCAAVGLWWLRRRRK